MLGGYTPSYKFLFKKELIMITENYNYYPQDNGEVLTLDELYKQQMEELEKEFPNHWTLKCLGDDELKATLETTWGLWGLTKAK